GPRLARSSLADRGRSGEGHQIGEHRTTDPGACRSAAACEPVQDRVTGRTKLRAFDRVVSAYCDPVHPDSPVDGDAPQRIVRPARSIGVACIVRAWLGSGLKGFWR